MFQFDLFIKHFLKISLKLNYLIKPNKLTNKEQTDIHTILRLIIILFRKIIYY